VSPTSLCHSRERERTSAVVAQYRPTMFQQVTESGWPTNLPYVPAGDGERVAHGPAERAQQPPQCENRGRAPPPVRRVRRGEKKRSRDPERHAASYASRMHYA
jgi:hypothetical protein